MPLCWRRKPTEKELVPLLNSSRDAGFSYAAIGATANKPPAGFKIDHHRFLVGGGEAAFAAGRTALESWQQFQLGWVTAWPSDTPLQPGEVVAVMANSFGLWWLNTCRIVYRIDEKGPIHRFGFAYGTLPQHLECGEERFMLEWNRETDEVYYDIFAFSKPQSWLTRIGYPYARRSQKRFARDSGAALQRYVAGKLATSAS